MKTNLKYSTLAATILLTVFASCTKENPEIKPEEKPKSLFLKIDNGITPHSESGATSSGTKVGLSSGNIYFVNASGTIVKHYTLSSGKTEGININLKEIEGGTTIENLPGSITNVHVTGNTPDLPASGNISAVKAAIIQIQTQKDIELVNLYGHNTLIPPVAPATNYTCIIDLNPTLARIELADITAKGAITGFEVEGIFIDNYYNTASVDGTIDETNLKSNGSDATIFNNETAAYPIGLKNAIYDFYNPALTATDKVVKPKESNHVWGYNLFASEEGSTVPRIIIRLKNITTNNGTTIANPQFITVKGFVNGDAALKGIRSGEIYSIAAGSLSFDETQLTPVPNQNTIDVNVTINLAKWKVVNVTPEI